MFAPDGYCLIEKLEDAFRGQLRTRIKVLSVSEIVNERPEDIFEAMSQSAQRQRELEDEVRRLTLMFLEDVESLSICSPTGLVLKISASILSTTVDFGNKLMGYATRADLRPLVLGDSWLVRNNGYFGVLQHTPMTELVNAKKRGTPEAKTERDMARFCEPYRDFIGWSLTFRSEDFPQLKRLQELCGTGESLSPIGRPKKQELALAAFEELYPDGRKGVIWKVVEQAVSDMIGENVSHTTIKRALTNRSKAGQK